MPTQVEGTIEFVQHIADGRVVQSGNLAISIMPFNYEVDGKRAEFVGVTNQAVTDNASNYVYVDHEGNLQVTTVGWPDNTHVRLALVTASGGVIIAIQNKRVFLVAALDKEINYESDEAIDTTALTDWQEKLKLSVVGIPVGIYLIQWYCEMKHSNNTLSEYAEARVMVDDTTEIGQSLWPYGNYEDMAGFRVYDVGSAGDHEFDIDFRVQGGGTAYIRRARLFLWRIGG